MKKKERLNNGLLTIGEVAKEAGVLCSTVRYYTKIGLLRVSGVIPRNGYRLYDRKETVSRIKKIKAIAQKKYTLEDIKKEFF